MSVYQSTNFVYKHSHEKCAASLTMFVFTLVSVLLACSSSARGFLEETSVQETLREVIYEDQENGDLFNDTLIEPWNDDDGVEFARGMVSQKCLQCICLIESGCRNVGCKMDMGSYSCGYFQIKEPYWIDCGKPGSSWKACSADKTCASKCVQNYMKRYARWAHCPLRCEGFAREHNGGPRGCKSGSTIGYWQRLQRIRGCHGVQ